MRIDGRTNPSLPREVRSSVRGLPTRDAALFGGSNPTRHTPRFVPSFWTYRTSPTSSFVGTTRRTDVSAGGLSPKGGKSRTSAPPSPPPPSGRPAPHQPPPPFRRDPQRQAFPPLAAAAPATTTPPLTTGTPPPPRPPP